MAKTGGVLKQFPCRDMTESCSDDGGLLREAAYVFSDHSTMASASVCVTVLYTCLKDLERPEARAGYLGLNLIAVQ